MEVCKNILRGSLNSNTKKCFICNKSHEYLVEVTPKGLLKLKSSSKERADGNFSFLNKAKNVFVHEICRNVYTKPFYIEKAKKIEETKFSPPRKKLRMSDPIGFNWEKKVFYVMVMPISIPKTLKKEGSVRR